MRRAESISSRQFGAKGWKIVDLIAKIERSNKLDEQTRAARLAAVSSERTDLLLAVQDFMLDGPSAAIDPFAGVTR